jgi:uncharacterized protein YukE
MKPHPLALLIAALTVAAVVTVHTAERGARLDGPTVPKFSGNYAEDAQVLRDAQEQALELARALQEKSENPQMQAELAAAVAAIEQALKALDAAKASPDKLADATAAAKAAYQSLLKLAAREYQIQKQKNQGKGKGKGKQKQMQDMLDQLELKKEDDRYEKQSEAASQQNEEQREQLALLNRLKELAQRQEGVNEKLKELQTALQQAQTEEQKEEIRRQLKRLQEEQQQMLADIDEAKQRMEQPQNQSQYADERQQLDKTREQAAKAAEALEREAASEALAAGTRAQRELQDMSEEFRRKTSRAFSEEMRQMRTQARELAERQAEVGKQLEGMSGEQTKKRSLAEDDTRDQIVKQLEQQRAGLTNVLENMKRVSEQAEQAEPLLSRELYDTLRRTSQTDTEDQLRMMQELVRRGYDRQAAPFEQKARTEIDELRAGVERAARNVLGDEAESLRVARAELDQLSERLMNEMRQRAPEVAEQAQQQMRGRGAGQTNQLAGARPGESPDGQPQAQSDSRGEQKNGKGGKGSEPGEPGDGAQKSAQKKGGGQQKGEPKSGEGQRGEQPGQQPGQMAQGNQPGGQQPGTQPGQQPGQGGQQPGQQGQPGQQPGQQPGEQPSQQAGAQGERGQGGQGGQQPGGDQPGQQTARNESGQPNERTGGAQEGGPQRSQRREIGGGPLRNLGQRDGGLWMDGAIGGGPTDFGPILGEGYLDWSDRLRNVEEMLERPELRGDAARIREVVKGLRMEFKRHSKTPQWDVVQSRVFGPLTELRRQVSEELARIEGKDPLVPIDRDPVPGKFGELVRRYYESLGAEK